MVLFCKIHLKVVGNKSTATANMVLVQIPDIEFTIDDKLITVASSLEKYKPKPANAEIRPNVTKKKFVLREAF